MLDFEALFTLHFIIDCNQTTNVATGSVRLAELSLRDVFAAVIIPFDFRLKTKQSCNFFRHSYLLKSLYCLPRCNQGRRGSRGSRRSGRPSSCTCGCAPASGSWASFDLRIWLQKYLLGHFLIFGFGFKNTYLGRFPKASPTLSQEEPGSGVKNHLWRTMK